MLKCVVMANVCLPCVNNLCEGANRVSCDTLAYPGTPWRHLVGQLYLLLVLIAKY